MTGPIENEKDAQVNIMSSYITPPNLHASTNQQIPVLKFSSQGKKWRGLWEPNRFHGKLQERAPKKKILTESSLLKMKNVDTQGGRKGGASKTTEEDSLEDG
jgi:hypothetical protein